jgi:hypothetical protein
MVQEHLVLEVPSDCGPGLEAGESFLGGVDVREVEFRTGYFTSHGFGSRFGREGTRVRRVQFLVVLQEVLVREVVFYGGVCFHFFVL